MADLDALLELPGARAAFTFNDRGELREHRIAEGAEGLDATVLDLLCHMCVANTAIATMQARGWERMTGMEGFYPVEGFGFVGLEWSALTHGHCGVVLANEEADYEATYRALAAHGEP
ncbi:MAG TPA: DUF2173 family protein [Chromatiales bacterium]|nr:DUF2173 family protein [Chromatiales bacterium]